MAEDIIDSVTILGVPVHILTREVLLWQVSCFVGAQRRAQVMYANAHTLNMAFQQPALRHAMQQADLVYCDGFGVKVGAQLLGTAMPERMTGADWIYDLCTVCRQRSYSLYLLGGRDGFAASAAGLLRERYPGLQILGTHQGYFEHDGEENRLLVEEINALQPDILLVGLGTPLQELWIARNAERLEVPVIWAVGALMDFVVGRLPRAPQWMLNHGLEWLGRLLAEPRRLWKRYVIGNPIFLWRVLKQRWGWLGVR